MNKFILITCILLCLYVYGTIQLRNHNQKSYDTKSQSLKPWAKSDDFECTGFDISFGQSLKPILFAVDSTKYRSIADIVQQVTGMFFGKVLRMKKLGKFQKEHGLYGYVRDPFDGTTIVQKASFYDFNSPDYIRTKIAKRYTKGIVLISDPLQYLTTRAMKDKDLTYLKYMAEVEPSKAKETARVLARDAKVWVESLKNVIRNTKASEIADSELKIIHYDDFVGNPEKYLTQITKYLNVKLIPKRLECALNYFKKIQTQKEQDKHVQKAKKLEAKLFKKVKKDLIPVKKVLKAGLEQINQLLFRSSGENRNENTIHIHY